MNWMKPRFDGYWRDYEYCSLDIETTGLNLQDDEVISVGAVHITDGRFKSEDNFYQEILPAIAPSVSSIQIHGLRGVDLENARSVSEVIPELITHIGGRVLITHAAWVERGFLSQHMKKYGYKFPKRVIDTAALARACALVKESATREPSLEALARKLKLPVYAPHHALGDAMTTSVVFLALTAELERLNQYKSRQPLSLQDLLDLSQ